MKRIIKALLSILMILTVVSCTSTAVEEPIALEVSELRSIAELATMECYFHNVAKYDDEGDRILIWNINKKKFWIEYSGVVTLGIDASKIQIEVNDNLVTITLPKAKVLDTTIDETSLTEDSYVVDQSSGKIGAAEETKAFQDAKQAMIDKASSDESLLMVAQNRAKLLLENYVNNIGELTGKTYTINWKYLSE